jgi:hypothetical protein
MEEEDALVAHDNKKRPAGMDKFNCISWVQHELGPPGTTGRLLRMRLPSVIRLQVHRRRPVDRVEDRRRRSTS